MSQMENELARIKVDSLNAKSHNEELEKSVDAIINYERKYLDFRTYHVATQNAGQACNGSSR